MDFLDALKALWRALLMLGRLLGKLLDLLP